ncbi:MAG TPA: Rrf2 family transcriptional regulator [Sedimentisphaerales bacterium]|nr:Rrf2 family transcriptional regulator [Sedimentisphaerales bacterium]
MDILRRNTDYGFRMMGNLAKHFNDGQLLSARQLTSSGNFSYQLGCKLLQKLEKAKLVKSTMGPKGGFSLNRQPSQITIMDIIKVFQNGVRLNSCLLDGPGCEFQTECAISAKLFKLQQYINDYLEGITLAEALVSKEKGGVEHG